MAPLRVAFVAPSLKKDDRGALQAGCLLRGWEGDRDVDARMVRHGFLREVARADIVHVFLSDSLFVPAIPALIAAHVLGRPVILSYQGDHAPAHLNRSAIARMAVARVINGKSFVLSPKNFTRMRQPIHATEPYLLLGMVSKVFTVGEMPT